MIQCCDCEFFDSERPTGQQLRCDPLRNIKEPQCLAKWQLIKTQKLIDTQQATLGFYQRLSPMQDKMFRLMQKEINGLDESESWRESLDENYDDELLDDWD